MNTLEIVTAFSTAMEAMDFDEALKYVADDVEYRNGPNPPVHGPDGIRKELEPFFAPIVENRFEILRTVVKDGVVFSERRDHHRVAFDPKADGWFTLPVTGV
ncbi:MAG: limonene-1,2-epoxide hydrolase family protein [Pseudomonadota bacterium]